MRNRRVGPRGLPLISDPGWGLGSAARRALKLAVGGQRRSSWRRTVGWMIVLSCILLQRMAYAVPAERDPVTISVVVVNPSGEKTQTVPVRMDLPQEVTPSDVIDKGDMSLEYDDDKSLYYVFDEAVELAPKQTRVFEVIVRDLWYVPEEEVTSLKDYTGLLLGKLKETEYAASAKQMAESVLQRLTDIERTQNDEAIGRKARIGAYRLNRQAIARIKEDLARMEKLLTFTGGPPVPEMMEESPLKSDAPSTTTTWLVIFLIMIFLSLLGGQFFFTWHRRTKGASEVPLMRPGERPNPARTPSGSADDAGNGRAGSQPAAAPGRLNPSGQAPPRPTNPS